LARLDRTRERHGVSKPALDEIFPSIASRNIKGYRGISLVRRDQDTEVEFVTIMWFDSIAAVRAFAGDNYEIAVVPAKAQAVMSRFDDRSAHYETIVPPPPSATS
jgi:heme-degrading monooxygenase HmoA